MRALNSELSSASHPIGNTATGSVNNGDSHGDSNTSKRANSKRKGPDNFVFSLSKVHQTVFFLREVSFLFDLLDSRNTMVFVGVLSTT